LPLPSVLLAPPRAAGPAGSSRPPADDVPDGDSSHLLAVPVPVAMDPATTEDAAVAKQVSDPPLPSFALRLFPSRLITIVGLLLQVPEVAPRPPERDFAGTPYVPVYVMLPVSTHLLHFLLLDLRDRVPIRVRVFGSLGW
jgi:beta-amylase